jgi:hypothetical protein
MPTVKRYRVDLMRDDMDELGWMPSDLFRFAEITKSRGYQFLRGEFQTAPTAEALTRALGKPRGYYLIRRAKKQPEASLARPA